MKANKSALFFVLLMTAFIQESCDTTLNVKSPASSYFIKYFGNEGSQTGADFVVNPDGTFVLFGTTQKGSADPRFYLVKADAKGNVMWEKTFGTAKCQARDVELATDGRIVVLGNMIAPNRTDYDVYLKTFLQDGTPKESLPLKNYNDVTSAIIPANEDASTVTQTNDGFIVAGSSGNIAHPGDPNFIRDAFFLRVDDNLVLYTQGIWPAVPAYGRGTENIASKIVQLPDSTFYVFGSTKFNKPGPQTDFDFWYFKLSKTAGPFSDAYLGSPGKDQRLFSVAADTTSLGTGFFLGGLETDPSGDRIYFTQLNHPPLAFTPFDAGHIAPQPLGIDLGKLNTVLNPPNPSIEFVSVCASKSSGFFVLTNEVTTGNNNLILTKFDSKGIPAWKIIFGGQGDDFAGSVQELPDGKIVIIGTMTIGQASPNNGETKMVLIKVNKDGEFAD